MHLAWLQASDFRCYQTLEFRPDPGVNLLVGDNGSGKSTILEAIGYLATLSSFRRAPDQALVRVGAAAAVVRGEFSQPEGTVRVETEIPERGLRRVLVDGKKVAGRGEVAARIALVAFLPDDLDLVKRGPVYRREYLDDLSVQLWPVAAAEQQDYERALRQRNALLRRDGRRADPSTLDVWDERLAILGAALVRRRLLVGERLVPVAGALCLALGTGQGSLDWSYLGAGVGLVDRADALDDIEDRLRRALAAAREDDGERRVTSVGPHRDELMLRLDGRDLRTRASQGEQRTVALALRVAAFDLLAEQRRASPVLVLDDVFSELDAGRRSRLAERFPSGQVFVSTTRDEDVPLTGTRWVVSGGVIGRGDGP
jgi:DNA replication and repair protein RecF